MFVKDGKSYRKVYERKRDGSRFFLRDGKRVNVVESRQLHDIRPKPECKKSQDERLPSGRCSKKCKSPKSRNPKTSRCKA